jgi:general secretion pathway protein C
MAFDRILEKNFGALVLLGAAVGAFLSALGVVRIAQAAVVPDAALLAAAPVLARPTVNARGRDVSADPILARNPFDSETGALGQFVLDHDASKPTNAPTCSDVKVMIIAQAADPDWSFAAMRTDADAKSALRRRGDDFGGKHVEFVSWDRVWLSSNGSICQAALFENASAKNPDAIQDANKSSSASLDPEIAKGIHRVSAKEFKIDRSVIGKVAANQNELTKIRVVPEQENGKTIGVRLYGIKSGSLLAVLGLQNGDRVDTINGLEISAPDRALAAYAQLLSADHLVVKLNRQGTGTQIDYDIH